MDKLLNEYKEKGAVNSKLANFVWKGGIIAFSALYFVFNWKSFKVYSVFVYLIILIALLLVAEYIFLKNAVKKMKSDTKPKLKNRNKIYDEIDAYQKDWIIKFCKDNKFKEVDKLKIMLDELKLDDEISNVKYINPIIIATLSLTIWESVIQEIVEAVGILNMIAVAIVLIIGISVGIGLVRKMIAKDREVITSFDIYSSKKRLEKLLLYSMLTIDD